MLSSAIQPRPPLAPSPAGRDAARSAVILAGAAGLVTLITLALSGAIAPRASGPAVTVPTDGGIIDLASEPTALGGLLTVSGDRTGSMTVVTADSEPGYRPDSSVAGGLAFDRGQVVLAGPEGNIIFDPRSGDISSVVYDGLTFFLDPGDCTASPGGRNGSLGLLHLRLDCPAIAEVRGGGIIGLEGIISVPADILGDRGGLPESGGTLDVGDASMDLLQGIGIVGGVGPVDAGLVPLLVPAGDLSGLGIMFDPEDRSYELTVIQIDGALSELTDSCPLPSEELGRLNPETTVVRLTVACDDVTLPDATRGSVSGSIVVDLVELGDGT